MAVEFVFLAQAPLDGGQEYESPQFEFEAPNDFVAVYLDPNMQDWRDADLQVTIYLDHSTDGGFTWEVWDNDFFQGTETNINSPTGLPYIGRGGNEPGDRIRVRLTLNQAARLGVNGRMQQGEHEP